jgi:hypothetical protein
MFSSCEAAERLLEDERDTSPAHPCVAEVFGNVIDPTTDWTQPPTSVPWKPDETTCAPRTRPLGRMKNFTFTVPVLPDLF